jgi:exonuclease SbcC
MRFITVHAIRFGPLTDSHLTLKPGLNVIFGRNESGKSTWHSAIYASLCGVRRGRGQPKSDDKQFAERHRPWEGQRWELECRIALGDNTEIDLRHDLAGGFDSKATDCLFGRDVSSAIINDGSPDGSVWLGLNRKAFLATACVRQAEVKSIVDSAGLLQQYLQRASSTADLDATAAAAIDLLRKYQAEYVGLDRANSSKPLQSAHRNEERCRKDLADARRQHELFEESAQGLAMKRDKMHEAHKNLHEVLARRHRAEVDTAEKALVMARELLVLFPDAKEPTLSEDAGLERTAHSALQVWERRPRIEDLTGQTADQLEVELAALPELPCGDREPSSAAILAHEQWLLARERKSIFDTELGTLTNTADPRTVQRERETTRELESNVEQLPAKRRAPEPQEEPRAPMFVYALFGTGAFMLITGFVALFAGFLDSVVSCILIGCGIGLVLFASKSLGKQIDAEPSIGMGPGTETESARRRFLQQSLNAKLELAAAERNLLKAIGSNDTANEDVERLWASYEGACRLRNKLAETSHRRPEILARLEARRKAELQHVQDVESLQSAQKGLVQVATDCGLNEDHENTAALVEQIQRWLANRELALRDHEERIRAWGELQRILGGRSIEQMETAVLVLKGRSDLPDLASDSTCSPSSIGDEELGELSAAYEDFRDQVRKEEGRIEKALGDLPDMNEVESQYFEAQIELQRVEQLRDTLDRTIRYLVLAEQGSSVRLHLDSQEPSRSVFRN